MTMRKILFLFLAVFAASVLANQAPVAQAAKTQQLDANLSSSNLTAKDKNAQKLNLTQDPAIASGELANGLKYYVKENKQPANSAYFYLVVNIGSTDERENELGLAHFTEHMAFNGSREFRRLQEQQIDLAEYSFSTVFVDPPRAGVDDDTLKLLARFDRIIYISCNPETLRANLDALLQTHTVERAALFDQFPFTGHIESGLLLHKKAV